MTQSPPPPEEQETYKGWTVLGQVDLDSFVDSHVTTAQDFEENYKVVRARRREAEKLPEIIKVTRPAEEGNEGFTVRVRVRLRVLCCLQCDGKINEG